MITANSNPYEAAASSFNQAGQNYGALADGSYLTNISSYIDPYYQTVRESVLGRMERDRDLTLQNIGDSANAAGAFGGSRHGVVEGTYLGDYNRNVGDISNEIASVAYNDAVDRMRGDLTTSAQGATGLGSIYYGVGNDVSDRQLAAGQRETDFTQRLLSGTQQSYENLLNSPYGLIDMFNALNSSDARRGAGVTTQIKTPGLYDYLALIAGVMGASYEG